VGVGDRTVGRAEAQAVRQAGFALLVGICPEFGAVVAATGIIMGVGNVTMEFTDTFELSGITLGTLVVITGHHALRAFAPARLRTRQPLLDEGTSSYDEEGRTGNESGTGDGTQRAKS
jgi:hypothetical protein